jgi:hypothetical protein
VSETAGDVRIGGTLRLGLARSRTVDFQIERALADQADEGAAVGEVLAVAAELRQFEDRGAW